MFNDARVDARTALQLAELQRLFGRRLVITQGSYNRGVGASAGTHNGGGAVDLSVRGLDRSQVNLLVYLARCVGFAAWRRPYRAGVWAEHVHMVSVGCPDLAAVAERQVAALRRGRDGLADDGPDPHAGFGLPVITWEKYRTRPMLPARPGWKSLRAGSTHPFVRVVQVALGREETGTMSAGDLLAVKAYRKRRPPLWPARAAVGPLTGRWLAAHPRVKARWRR